MCTNCQLALQNPESWTLLPGDFDIGEAYARKTATLEALPHSSLRKLNTEFIQLLNTGRTTLQIFQDISEAYARKTATVEAFPHSSVRALGIHPCKHAETMRRLADTSADAGGRRLDPEQCVFPPLLQRAFRSLAAGFCG